MGKFVHIVILVILGDGILAGEFSLVLLLLEFLKLQFINVTVIIATVISVLIMNEKNKNYSMK